MSWTLTAVTITQARRVCKRVLRYLSTKAGSELSHPRSLAGDSGGWTYRRWRVIPSNNIYIHRKIGDYWWVLPWCVFWLVRFCRSAATSGRLQHYTALYTPRAQSRYRWFDWHFTYSIQFNDTTNFCHFSLSRSARFFTTQIVTIYSIFSTHFSDGWPGFVTGIIALVDAIISLHATDNLHLARLLSDVINVWAHVPVIHHNLRDSPIKMAGIPRKQHVGCQNTSFSLCFR